MENSHKTLDDVTLLIKDFGTIERIAIPKIKGKSNENSYSKYDKKITKSLNKKLVF